MGLSLRRGLLGVDVLERFIGWLMGSLAEYWYGGMDLDLDEEDFV